MPTSYTDEIYRGKEVSGEDFILRCARQFGGLMHMRDEPLDTPITYREPDLSYYDKRIKEATEQARKYHRVSREEVEKEIDKTHKEMVETYHRRVRENAELESRYRIVLSEVQTWNPPTPEHEELKEFAIKQLEDSIEFDCSARHLVAPKKPDVDEYIAEMIESAEESREYYVKEKKEEIERVNAANKWIDELLISLGKGEEIK